ncbi:MAG: hypothetical protein HQL35_06825 [Alphaproteobacteria bacterium]|nr:hypothetical protein [Alphaproteobacteria bacterium]
MTTLENRLIKLELPRRWEFLVQRAEERDLSPADFVEKVEDSAGHIDNLLERINRNGGGVFEVVYGLSGSGKTTFLKTLPRFFDIKVHSFPKSEPLTQLPKFVEQTYVQNGSPRVVLIEKRDNPKASDVADAEPMLAELLETFRTLEGSCLVLWPITKQKEARKIAEIAWLTGRDSVVDPSTRGIYDFTGLPKEKYFLVADATCKNLTGDGLDAFGITAAVVEALLPNCETIADFFASVDEEADKTRDATWSVLKERVRARLWIVLPGDVVRQIESTVKALTQGTRNRIDIDLLGEFIDRPGDSAPLYVADWKKRRASLAHLLRAIDLRLFGLPPNISLAAVRAFGNANVKGVLNHKTIAKESAKNAMKASRLYKALLTELGVETEPFSRAFDVKPETENEYRRLQALAAKGDKELNKCLGQLVTACLQDDAPNAVVSSEKASLPGSSLKPDVQVHLGGNDFICLEPTWRSTEIGIPDEIPGGQNTLTEAHIKMYLLDKATRYIDDLGL